MQKWDKIDMSHESIMELVSPLRISRTHHTYPKKTIWKKSWREKQKGFYEDIMASLNMWNFSFFLFFFFFLPFIYHFFFLLLLSVLILLFHFNTQSYASILYLRLPPGFRMILRGKDVEHHNIVNDMMLSQEVTYRPNPGADGASKNFNVMLKNNVFDTLVCFGILILIVCNYCHQMLLAVVTIGFVKDAKHHIDVQGFNVYHKNRLIKVWFALNYNVIFVLVFKMQNEDRVWIRS